MPVVGPPAAAEPLGPLATVGDYEALYGNAGDSSRVETALSYATAAVRAAGGRAYSDGTDVVETIDGDGGVIFLENYPVTDVDSVTVDDVELDPTDYEWTADGELRRLSGAWARGVRNVAVTYSHGAGARAEVAKAIVLAAAHRAVSDMAADPEGGFVSTSAAALTSDERAALGRLVML